MPQGQPAKWQHSAARGRWHARTSNQRCPASCVFPGQRRRTGIEPADDAERRPPVLKTAQPRFADLRFIVRKPVLPGQGTVTGCTLGQPWTEEARTDVPRVFPEELPFAYSFSYGVFLGAACLASPWWLLGAAAIPALLVLRRRWSS